MYQSSSTRSNRAQRAGSLFEWLYFKGQIKGLIARILGQSRMIRYLDSAVVNTADVEVEQVGLQAIRIQQIVGTQGRLNYDIEFCPLQRRDKKRWMSVAIAMMTDATTLSPITVIQVGDDYYTADGNHRVSVARTLNKLFIDAYVTRWHVPKSD